MGIYFAKKLYASLGFEEKPELYEEDAENARSAEAVIHRLPAFGNSTN